MKHSPRHSPSDSARHSLGDSPNHLPKYSWRHSRRYFDILRHSLRYLAKHSLRYFSRYSLQYTLNHFLFVYSPFRGVKSLCHSIWMGIWLIITGVCHEMFYAYWNRKKKYLSQLFLLQGSKIAQFFYSYFHEIQRKMFLDV